MANDFYMLLKIPIQFLNIVVMIMFLHNITDGDKGREKIANIIIFLALALYRYESSFIRNGANKYEFLVVGAINMLYFTICKKGGILKKIFLAVFTDVTYVGSFVIVYATYAYINKQTLFDMTFSAEVSCVTLIIAQLVQVISFLYLYSEKKILESITDELKLFFIGIFVANIWVLWSFSFAKYESRDLVNFDELLILYATYFVVMMIIFILQIFSKQFKYLSEAKMKEVETLQMKRYTEEIGEVFDKLKAWRHDWKNHLIVIDYLIQKKEEVKLEEYIKKIKDENLEVFKFIDVVKTDLPVLNALINSKIMLAKNQDVDMDIQISLEKDETIEDVDLCTLMGNLIDNAIEANPNGGWVNLRIQIIKGNLGIFMENSIGQGVRKEGDKFVTQKKGDFHGIGLLQIDSIVKKYNGFLERKAENKIFTTKIIIPIKNAIHE